MSEPCPEPSRQITADELCDMLIQQLKHTALWWAATARGDISVQERVVGAVFSVLTALDGQTDGLPAFDLVARVADGDKEDAIENGENWIEDGTTISTMLHEQWAAVGGNDGRAKT